MTGDFLLVKGFYVTTGFLQLLVHPAQRLHFSFKRVALLLQASLPFLERAIAGAWPEQITQQQQVHHSKHSQDDGEFLSNFLQVVHYMLSLVPVRGWAVPAGV